MRDEGNQHEAGYEGPFHTYPNSLSPTSNASSSGQRGRSASPPRSNNMMASSSGSSDDSASSRSHDRPSLYETNIARQLLALKDGVPAADLIAPRRQRQFIEETRKDDAYWDRRRKNNEAAKKSREKRRLNDMAMEVQISALNKDIDLLRAELLAMKKHYGLSESLPFVPCSSHNGVAPALGSQVASRAPSRSVKTSAPTDQTCSQLLQVGLSTLGPSTTFRSGAVVPGQQLLQLSPLLPQFCLTASAVPQPKTLPPSPAGDGRNPLTNTARCRGAKSRPVSLQNAPNQNVADVNTSSTCPPGDATFYGSCSLEKEQDAPLNLIVHKQEPRESYDRMSYVCRRRMQEEACRRYEEIKAGSIEMSDARSDGKRDSGVVSPGDSSTSSGGEPCYANKRLRIDTCDSVMEGDSCTGSEVSENGSFNKCLIDPKYMERRKKSNDASRRGRENRKHTTSRAREENTFVLKVENTKLRQELNSLASEVSNLRRMIEGRGADKNSYDVELPQGIKNEESEEHCLETELVKENANEMNGNEEKV